MYLINDKLYKIYNPEALNEGFGNKKNFHQSLLGMSDSFHSFILPEDLIFDENGEYVGYVTKLVDKNKNKEGITGLDWDNFISNIRNLEIETEMLSEERFLLIDVAFHNAIFNRETGNLYMIDPGRYRHYNYFSLADYKKRNKISNEIDTSNYSDYFESNKDKYDSVHEFLQVKSRFVK